MRLDVLIEGRLAGSLDIANPTEPVFRYDDGYRASARATPLSTRFAIEHGGPFSDADAYHWLLGLLPTDQRVLNSRCIEHQVPANHPLMLLSTPMGAECAGAVQFCPPSQTDELLEGKGGHHDLTDDEVSDWLQELSRDPAHRPNHVSGQGFSLSGMQPKIALLRRGGRWAAPWGSVPTTHILKITRSVEFPHEALIEHLTMESARRIGLQVSVTEVAVYDDLEVIIVSRYDRVIPPGSKEPVRIHQEDLCQALGVHPDLKYQWQGGPTPSVIASLLRNIRRVRPEITIEKFCDMLIFQWLIVGTDAHSKNYSLLLDGRECELAPLYDSASWLPYRGFTPISKLRLGMKIGRDYSLSSSDRPSALARLSQSLGLQPKPILERSVELASKLPRAVRDSVESLPADLQSVPEVEDLASSLARRSKQCEQIALDAISQLPA